MTKFCKNYIVSGQVQGVWFRATTQEKAKELDITGWVKNLPDGSVELIACGERTQLRELEDWLWCGPPLADVSDVQSKIIPTKEFDDFEIVR